MNKVNFDGRCASFLNYEDVEVYREGEKTIPKYFFYIEEIANSNLKLAPISGMNTDCIKSREELVSMNKIVLAEVRDDKIYLYPNIQHQTKLGDKPTISWLGHKKISAVINEPVVCCFQQNTNFANLSYLNFLKLFFLATENQATKNQKKSGCNIL